MRFHFYTLLFVLSSQIAAAQLAITPGSQFYMAGTANLTLLNTSIVNNGNFVAGKGTVFFTGNAQAAISGTQPMNFYRMTVNKTGGSAVALQREVGVRDRVLLTAGFLDLNDFNVDLGTSGWLSGESETARVTTAGTGKILLSTWVNASSGINPGNLGAVFSAAESLGNVLISRGHQVQVSANGTQPAVRRYYDIVLSKGPSFSGTLRLHYLNAELNDANEIAMTLYTSPGGSNWLEQTPGSRSSGLNYLEISGAISGKRWAMANGSPGSSTVAMPFGSDVPQKNVDPAQTQTGSKPNINNSSAAAPAFRLWPNPTTGSFFITLYSATKTAVAISIMDSKGTLVKAQQAWLIPGVNQVAVNARQLPAGNYTVLAAWNSGLEKKAARFVKQ